MFSSGEQLEFPSKAKECSVTIQLEIQIQILTPKPDLNTNTISQECSFTVQEQASYLQSGFVLVPNLGPFRKILLFQSFVDIQYFYESIKYVFVENISVRQQILCPQCFLENYQKE